VAISYVRQTSYLKEINKNHTGISQRDNNFYDFLQSSSRQRLFIDKVQELFEKHIKESFPSDNCEIPNFAYAAIVQFKSDSTAYSCFRCLRHKRRIQSFSHRLQPFRTYNRFTSLRPGGIDTWHTPHTIFPGHWVRNTGITGYAGF